LINFYATRLLALAVKEQIHSNSKFRVFATPLRKKEQIYSLLRVNRFSATRLQILPEISLSENNVTIDGKLRYS
jgi:hypothetical protein